jgi:hypothetical protein
MNSYVDDPTSPLCRQTPFISQNRTEPAGDAPSAQTAHLGELNASHPAIEADVPDSSHAAALNEQALAIPNQPLDDNGEKQIPEIFVCQFKRCKRRRERHGKPDSRFLFAAEWREMKIGALMVWVVDLTARCPECNTRHAATLIPPVISPALPRATPLF